MVVMFYKVWGIDNIVVASVYVDPSGELVSMMCGVGVGIASADEQLYNIKLPHLPSCETRFRLWAEEVDTEGERISEHCFDLIIALSSSQKLEKSTEMPSYCSPASPNSPSYHPDACLHPLLPPLPQPLHFSQATAARSSSALSDSTPV